MGESPTATVQADDAPARLVLASPLYRGATVALFLSGLWISAAAPQIARFLVTELDSSLPVAGLFYLTNLTAPVAGYLVGARSDRTGGRLGLFRLCAIAGFPRLGRHRVLHAAVDAVRDQRPRARLRRRRHLAAVRRVAAVGLPAVFLIPAALALLAATGLVVMDRVPGPGQRTDLAPSAEKI